jgi:hypothetical protein
MKVWFILLLAVVALIATFMVAPVPQDPAYHLFADQREMLGIPNFWNVVSNLPFMLVGFAGVWMLFKQRPPGEVSELRIAYVVFFAGVALVSIGSGYYHLAPSNASLLWDRLPMTIAFMAFFAIIIGENISIKAGARLLWPLLLVGLFSVVYWHLTEQRGAGDLRPYALVQFLPMVLMPLILLLFCSPYDTNKWLWLAMGAYGLAKVLEYADVPIYESLGMSGHALKHVAAALTPLFILLGVYKRQPV